MSTDDTQDRLAQLTLVLDTYGARQERWPAALRAPLQAFIAADGTAARLLAEAGALDKVLAAGPAAGATDALENRILAAAATLPQQGRGAAGLGRKNHGRALVGAEPKVSAARMWPELTLLAASLFLGLLIGLSGRAVPALQNIVAIADEQGLGTFTGLLFDPGGGPEQGEL